MFILFSRPYISSEDDLYFFILVEVFYKVSCYIKRRYACWLIKKQLACSLDLRHGLRICQQLMNVIAAQVAQSRRHGTTIHAYCLIQAEAELEGIHRYTLNQVPLIHISSNGGVQRYLCIHIGIVYAVIPLTAPLQV